MYLCTCMCKLSVHNIMHVRHTSIIEALSPPTHTRTIGPELHVEQTEVDVF